MKRKKYHDIDILINIRNLLITAALVALIFFISEHTAKNQKSRYEAENKNKGYSLCISSGKDTCECQTIFFDTCKIVP